MTQSNLKLVVSGAIPKSLDMAPLWPQTGNGGGWLFLDTSDNAEGYDQAVYMASRLGRAHAFKGIDFLTPVLSNTLGVLSGATDRVVSNLLSLLPEVPNSPGADYYRNSAKHALTVLVEAMRAADQRVTFRGLSEHLRSADTIRHLLTQVPTDSPAYRALLDYDLSFKNGLGIDKQQQLHGGIGGRIAMLANEKTCAILESAMPSVLLDDLVRDNALLYVRLPSAGFFSQAISRIILADLASARAQQGRPNHGTIPPFMLAELVKKAEAQ